MCSSALVRQLVKEKEYSELKPVKLRSIDILVDRPSHHTGTRRPPRGHLLAVEEVAETHVGIVVSLEGWPTQVDVEVC